MGKTAVCAALVLAHASKSSGGHGATIVLVNNTLVGQWVDEMQKFAPGLKVICHYGNKKQKELTQDYVDSCDILITTPHTGARRKSDKDKQPHGAGGGAQQGKQVAKLYCRRLILDESHLYEPKSEPKLPPKKVFEYYR